MKVIFDIHVFSVYSCLSEQQPHWNLLFSLLQVSECLNTKKWQQFSIIIMRKLCFLSWNGLVFNSVIGYAIGFWEVPCVWFVSPDSNCKQSLYIYCDLMHTNIQSVFFFVFFCIDWKFEHGWPHPTWRHTHTLTYMLSNTRLVWVGQCVQFRIVQHTLSITFLPGIPEFSFVHVFLPTWFMLVSLSFHE